MEIQHSQHRSKHSLGCPCCAEPFACAVVRIQLSTTAACELKNLITQYHCLYKGWLEEYVGLACPNRKTTFGGSIAS